MNEFYEKWKNDKKYRTKVKLIAYTAFVVIVSIYEISINNNSQYDTNTIPNNNTIDNSEFTTDKIIIPDNYSYQITINIDNETYIYSGQKTLNEEKIQKEINGIFTDYRYYNNEYYILNGDIYELTTKEMVYDIVNYNYINLENINKYLSKAKKVTNEYFIYLKDIILGNEGEDYFIIKLNNDEINIDYTKLIKEFNPNINRYTVDIKIKK